MGKDDEAAAKQGGGLMALALPALLAGGVALGVSALDPFGGKDAPPAEEGYEAKKDEHVEEKDEAMAGKPSSHLVVLDPLVVSLSAAEGATRRGVRLRLGVTLETDAATAETAGKAEPRLRDGFTAAARGLGPEALTRQGGLEALRAALLAQARAVLGEEAVKAVLITDYVLA